MIHSDCRSCDHAHLSAFQQLCITLGTGPDNQGICINYIIMIDFTSINVYHLCIRFENSFQKRYVFICYYFHITLFQYYTSDCRTRSFHKKVVRFKKLIHLLQKHIPLEVQLIACQ